MSKLLTILLALSGILLTAAEFLPNLQIWSGREQTLPLTASQGWKLETEHGRLVAERRAAGPVQFSLPPLNAPETFTLTVDDRRAARVTAHPAKPLAGLAAQLNCRRKELEALGMKHVEMAATTVTAPWSEQLERIGRSSRPLRIVVFTETRDFPLKIASGWQSILLGRPQERGGLGIVCDGRERLVDVGGGIGWLLAVHTIGDRLLLLPPDFDWNDLNQVLILQKFFLQKEM